MVEQEKRSEFLLVGTKLCSYFHLMISTKSILVRGVIRQSRFPTQPTPFVRTGKHFSDLLPLSRTHNFTALRIIARLNTNKIPNHTGGLKVQARQGKVPWYAHHEEEVTLNCHIFSYS